MTLEEKTKMRVKRHLRVIADAISRAEDGLNFPEGLLDEDTYVLGQLNTAAEAILMARSRITDYQTAAHAAKEDTFLEG